MQLEASERRASAVVALGIVYTLFKLSAAKFDAWSSVVIVLLNCVALLLLSFIDIPAPAVYSILLPICVVLSSSSEQSYATAYSLLSLVLSVGTNCWILKAACETVLWKLSVAVTVMSLALCLLLISNINSDVLLMTLAAITIQLFLCCYLPVRLPHSFTIGEVTIVTQGIGVFVLFACELYITATAILSCAIVLVILSMTDVFHSAVLYYTLVAGVAACVSLPILGFYFQQDFISWLVSFIGQHYVKIKLFVYWIAWSFGLWLIVYVGASHLEKCLSSVKQHTSNKAQDVNQPFDNVAMQNNAHNHDSVSPQVETDVVHTFCGNGTTGEYHLLPTQPSVSAAGKDELAVLQLRRRTSTITRKLFHVAALAIYIPGIIYDWRLLSMAVSCALVVIAMIESLRVLHIAPFGATIDRYFRVFVDDRDEGKVFTTHIYLLVGCSCPLWFYKGSKCALSLYSGLLSIGVGDTCASVFGSLVGRHKWPGSSKTIEGTVASFIAQLLFVFAISFSGDLLMPSWCAVVLCVVLNSLLEAFTTQIDNLVLPLFTYLMLALPA